MTISIHAPVKGATYGFFGVVACHYDDFNPRTREGCDLAASAVPMTLPYFNPRTREGCDRQRPVAYFATQVISIHAPVKGATY